MMLEPTEDIPGDAPNAAPPPELANEFSTGVVRFRLAPKIRNGLILVAGVSAIGLILAIRRANRSAAALANFFTEANTRGPAFTNADAVHAADRDKIALVAISFITVAIWCVVMIVWALRRTRLRLDSEGLWWVPSHGLRWRGPITHGEFVAMQPGAKKRGLPIPGIQFLALGNRTASWIGIYDMTVLYLRSEAGLEMNHALSMDLPSPPPEAANSVILVPEALFQTNPKFRKTLLSWILS